jgi:hypothetical protein
MRVYGWPTLLHDLAKIQEGDDDEDGHQPLLSCRIPIEIHEP